MCELKTTEKNYNLALIDIIWVRQMHRKRS